MFNIQEINDIKMLARVIKTKLRLFGTPDASKEALYDAHGTELLYGERFEINEKTANGWVRGVSLTDGYQGWVNQSGLENENPEQMAQNVVHDEYRVCIPIAPLYREPHLKSHIHYHIPFEGKFSINDPAKEQNGFVFADEAEGWIFSQHIRKVNSNAINDVSKTVLVQNIIDSARLFLQTPYIYGGRTVFGIDCSALIQVAFAANGVKLPRDSKPQAKDMVDKKINESLTIKRIEVEENNPAAHLQAGDIVFFPGHVGLMIDQNTIIHASSKSMRVVQEDVQAVHEYYMSKERQGINAIRRISSLI